MQQDYAYMSLYRLSYRFIICTLWIYPKNIAGTTWGWLHMHMWMQMAHLAGNTAQELV